MTTALCRSQFIQEGDCKSFRFATKNIFVLRKNGYLRAFINRCPHLGSPLNWQPDKFFDAENELIQCASHGARFLPETGECVSGPCLGRNLSSLELEEKDNQIWIVDAT